MSRRNRPRPPQRRPPFREELVLSGIAHGGEAVGRLADGRVCFVAYALPGERVLVEVVQERRRWVRARLLEVLEPSGDRVAPPCPLFGPGGCGGCQLQHVAPARQAALKRQVVADALQRLGGVAQPPVTETVTVGERGYRNTARLAVDARGRLGFRRSGSRRVVPVDDCLLLEPSAAALLPEAERQARPAGEVVVRAGNEGRLVLADGEVRHGGTVTFVVAGFRYRVSPGSFFQSNTAGAEVLVDLVQVAAAAGPRTRALDLYAGVGLFSLPLAASGAHVVAVEANPQACADARHNLAGRDALVVNEDTLDAVTRLRAQRDRFDVVVLDPPRAGAGAHLSTEVAALEPRTIVYVACDPAALGRDTRALVAAGYLLERAVPVDQFAQTAHVETVATFRREPAGEAPGLDRTAPG